MTTGYSGTPLPKKLGIREDSRVRIVNPPPELGTFLAPPPAPPAGAEVDVLILFVHWQTELRAALDDAFASLAPRGGLWVAWPKRASRVPTDVTEDVLREVILPTGWVDNKVCAISDVWSGLRFVRRVK